MSSELIRRILLIVVIGTIIFIYLTYVVISFYFMHQFKRKIVNSLQSINVFIYQKYETLDKASHFLVSLGYDNPKLIEFDELNAYKNYKPVAAKELEGVFNESENVYSLVKSIVINFKSGDDVKSISSYLNSIDALNTKYFETIQLYNTYVVGYNYWRNLFFTKWIKVLFKKEEIDTIK
jgi:hypothetical protein